MSPRPAQVRIYCDADVRGLGIILGALRNDITYPGDPGAVIHKRERPPCPITSPHVLDTEWIPVVAAQEWLIITRDSKIMENPAEIAGGMAYYSLACLQARLRLADDAVSNLKEAGEFNSDLYAKAAEDPDLAGLRAAGALEFLHAERLVQS